MLQCPSRASVRMRVFPHVLALSAAVLFGACASAGPPRPPGPSEVAAMERRLAADSNDVRTLVQLGQAYRAAGRAGESAVLLERAVRLDPRNGEAVLFLGLAYEDAGEAARAREHYETFLKTARSTLLRSQLEGRLELLHREELRAAARAALARESELSSQAPEPRTLAVMPFVFEGANEELRPLSRALADMVTTDLGQVDRVTLLERAQVQALFDEMALGMSGAVDPQTAARSGMLLRAGTVVQGRVAGGEETVRLDAAIVDATSRNFQPASAEASVMQILDAEKQLVLSVFRSLNIELTPAEQDRIRRRPTQSLGALLAYGQGLEAADRGDMASATQHFSRALQLDPGFTIAGERAQATAQAEAASRTTTSELAQLATEAVSTPSLDDAIANVVPTIGRTSRDAASEALGDEGLGRRALLRIILRRP